MHKITKKICKEFVFLKKYKSIDKNQNARYNIIKIKMFLIKNIDDFYCNNV